MAPIVFVLFSMFKPRSAQRRCWHRFSAQTRQLSGRKCLAIPFHSSAVPCRASLSFVANLTRNFSTSTGAEVPRIFIDKMLIANRGEIACRIMKTARKMGVKTVAVYSEADRDAMHVLEADEAVFIGPAPAAQSYLRGDVILDAAKVTGAAAVHPGYGFLSENADFADLCLKEGVEFVGPPSNSIREMGIKNAAKKIMIDADVPVVMGYHGEDQSDEKLRSVCREEIGYPVMLKAVYGGGGKGMRICMTDEDFDYQLEAARREAKKAFGNDEMMVEKFVANPRHVEVQVFGDKWGNHVYLFERDCSVQRRHQKIIEEAPAPGITEETRKYLGDAAVKAAKAVNYHGAGTVEFIMDENQKFYFMEMNTRLQVEHPVTELITGLDLVEWQIRVAQGEPLPIVDQERISLTGHAFESRIYAEDPSRQFMPGAGTLHYLRFAQQDQLGADSLRVETGVRQGDEVSVHYDPMIAKLVVGAEDRQSAIRLMDAVLSATQVVGVKTNVDFIRQVLKHEKFRLGHVYTEFIADHQHQLFPDADGKLEPVVLAEAAVALMLSSYAKVFGREEFNPNDPFSALNSFRLNMEHEETVLLNDAKGQPLPSVKIRHLRGGGYLIKIDADAEFELIPELVPSSESSSPNTETVEFASEVGGHRRGRVKAVFPAPSSDEGGQPFTLFTPDGTGVDFQLRLPKWAEELLASGGSGGVGAAGDAVSPMPGVVEKLYVKAGDQVTSGDNLLVMVAMKMEYALRAPKDGRVKSVNCQEGESVAKGVVLVHFEEDEDEE